MNDQQYRAEVARQNTTYIQPSYIGFYFASDTDFSAVPVPVYQSPGMLIQGTSAEVSAFIRFSARGEQETGGHIGQSPNEFGVPRRDAHQHVEVVYRLRESFLPKKPLPDSDYF
ncbi:hypothetical protein [Paenibacillus sp. ISL-20]|uniref:hypothetical protein n=1 Tax=Paenibacillus sp. ISL-20 TaxID=2819163 RepID=UPI0020350AA3|nr:hypothetical protein [Paenibacillus sp. ISL-20]